MLFISSSVGPLLQEFLPETTQLEMFFKDSLRRVNKSGLVGKKDFQLGMSFMMDMVTARRNQK